MVVNPIITKSVPNKLTLSATEFANIYEINTQGEVINSLGYDFSTQI